MHFCSPLRCLYLCGTKRQFWPVSTNSREKHAAESMQVVSFPFAISRVAGQSEITPNMPRGCQPSGNGTARKRAYNWDTVDSQTYAIQFQRTDPIRSVQLRDSGAVSVRGDLRQGGKSDRDQ
jgi:hypothetical protein